MLGAIAGGMAALYLALWTVGLSRRCAGADAAGALRPGVARRSAALDDLDHEHVDLARAVGGELLGGSGPPSGLNSDAISLASDSIAAIVSICWALSMAE